MFVTENIFNKNTHPYCHSGMQYALDVIAGKIVSCVYVRGACRRFLREVVNTTNKKWIFDKDRAERYLRLVQKFPHVKGHWENPNIIYEPWQNWIWMNIEGFVNRTTGFRRFRRAHVEVPRGNAKAFWIETDVLTPDGLKKWKDIQIGSKLFDRNGNICTVTNKNEVHYPEAYEIIFSDGEKLICSDKHLWFTQNRDQRREKRGKESIVTTEEIFNSLRHGGETNHSISNTKPLKGRRKKFLIDPYLLGYWIGNGESNGARMTCHRKDADSICKILKSRGIEITSTIYSNNSCVITPSKLRENLRQENILGNKHIPEKYLTASVEQRLELLRGIMDADGTINSASRGQCSISQVRENIIESVNILLCSLGYKTSRSIFKVSENNNYKSSKNNYRITFYPRGDVKVFNLERKYKKQVSVSGVHGYTDKRYIKNIVKLKNKYPMFCVEVDSKDKSYLIGKALIPTHNSAMASQNVLFNLALDNPNGNNISTAATKTSQARIVLDDARAMAEKSKSYRNKTGVKVRAHSIVHEESNSIARALSAEAKTLDGLNDIVTVCDELHAMERDVFEVITSGMSKRRDSLLLCITTAGIDKSSVGYEESIFAKKICLGEVEDDTIFAVVYTIDENDDIYKEETWRKANPGFGTIVDAETFKSKLAKTLESPADLPNFKIKHLNMWTEGAEAFFDLDKWDMCANRNMKLEDYRGIPCRVALDLSSHIDLTVRLAIFEKDGKYHIWDEVYLPEETIKNSKDKKNKDDRYEEWAKDGWLTITPGAAINYEKFGEDLIEFAQNFKVLECAYDPWQATEMAQRASSKIEMVEFRMGVATISEPMKKLDSYIRQGKIVHRGSPLVRWNMGNVVAKEDHNGNVYPRKEHKRLKIDVAVAMIMALALWIQDNNKESIYEDRGIRTI